MIRLYNVDLGIVQAIWKKEVGQNKYQTNKISEDWLLLIFPEEHTYLQKLLKKYVLFVSVLFGQREQWSILLVLSKWYAVLFEWGQMWMLLTLFGIFFA